MTLESHPSWVKRYHQTSLNIVGSNCQGCGEVHFPGREICPDCGHNNNTPTTKTEIAPTQTKSTLTSGLVYCSEINSGRK